MYINFKPRTFQFKAADNIIVIIDSRDLATSSFSNSPALQSCTDTAARTCQVME